MNNLVKVKLHGEISNFLPSSWELKVKSVAEAIRAINSLTNNKFNDYFIQNDKLHRPRRPISREHSYEKYPQNHWRRLEIYASPRSTENKDRPPFSYSRLQGASKESQSHKETGHASRNKTAATYLEHWRGRFDAPVKTGC